MTNRELVEIGSGLMETEFPNLNESLSLSTNLLISIESPNLNKSQKGVEK